MFAIRSGAFNSALATNVFRGASTRAFHASRPSLVKVGDAIPDIELHESSPGNKVSLAKELASPAKGIIIGVPAAFSPSCSAKHVPGYLNSDKLKDAGKVFVVSVNDAFVMKAWASTLDPSEKSGIRFLADPAGNFTKALSLDFDAPAVFGGARSKRYALVIEEGKVKEAHVEPDNTGVFGEYLFMHDGREQGWQWG
ncbi:AhpC/TSA family protein [Elsinoe ampelina]|uniref:AhpC/TSA family protein n=1 Tax=Elsinoe ampelina TaxID=302913 RepID=A0A6A6GQ23_9PEZI|nr:AhpC/TSA family protein [Elsinoe ampelina]